MRLNTLLLFVAIVVAGHSRGVQGQSPDSLESGFERLNKVLGRTDQLGPWRISLDAEFENQPYNNARTVVVVINGTQTFSTPYRLADAIVFDNVASWRTKVYDLDDNGRRTLTRDEMRHSARRYSCRLHGENWYFDSYTVMHSKPEYSERPYHRGAIIWHKNGFELRGIGGLDKSFGADGELIPVVSYGSQRFQRDGEVLTVSRESQSFELLTGPRGEVLPVPDFEKPKGAPFKEEQSSADE